MNRARALLAVDFSLRARWALATIAAATGAGCYDDGEPEPGVCEFEGAETVPSEGWLHVDDAEPVYEHNPPASGPHHNTWASYSLHTDLVARANWVHNLEHGAIVLLIGPDASDAQRQTMLDGYEAIPNDPNCGHKRSLLTDDPELDSHVAVVAADHVLEGDALTVEQIKGFALACRDHAREDICY